MTAAGGTGGSGVRGPRRVAVTGIGAITPVGHGAEGLWQGVLANRSAVRLIDRFDAAGLPSRVAAQVDDFDPADYLDRKQARRLDRFSQLAVAASRMAIAACCLSHAEHSDGRTGIWIGSALGGVAFGQKRSAAAATQAPGMK